MEVEFKSIGIVGLGLIGGSIAKALKEKGFKGKIYGVDINEDNISDALLENVIIQDELNHIDLLILAIPIGKYKSALLENLKYLKEDCIITDVGSVKVKTHEIIEKLILPSQIFVGGHPMIGSEKSGFKVSKAHLFENAYYFLTSRNKKALKKIENFVDFLGAKAVSINPELHDRIVARTSHLPHINAMMMVNLLREKDEMLINYVGGGFRDTTRIASGDPFIWSDILMNNTNEIVDSIDEFINGLEEFKNALQEKDIEKIKNQLFSAKKYRNKIPKHLHDSIEVEYTLFIDVKDKPGMISSATGLLAKHQINIKDIEIVHARENIPGVLKLGLYSKRDQLIARQLIESSEFGKWNPVHHRSE
ncbi:MAG: prephenate dehydrogenase/arogenate dehydrogenase family protein [Clostridiales bacterium]|nr:prephenate dehydrogenase/arogenate dehydrogenase family protein [Clostridiales bacterium]